MNHQNKISYVIYYMCRGLENPTVKVDMMSFGEDSSGREYGATRFDGTICAGCAATNAFLVDHHEAIYDYAGYVDVVIENEIDRIRLVDLPSACCALAEYFYYDVSDVDLVQDITVRHLSNIFPLRDGYTLEQLKPYRALADDLYLAGF